MDHRAGADDVGGLEARDLARVSVRVRVGVRVGVRVRVRVRIRVRVRVRVGVGLGLGLGLVGGLETRDLLDDLGGTDEVPKPVHKDDGRGGRDRPDGSEQAAQAGGRVTVEEVVGHLG